MVEIKTYYLYEVRHKTEPIVYVGMTGNPRSRFKDHRNKSGNTKLRSFIEEKGADSFNFNILRTGYYDEIQQLEREYIINYKASEGLNVCNVVAGGGTHHGEENPNAKLKEIDVLDIRNSYALGGVTQKELSEIYGIPISAISKITRGIAWKLVGGPTSKNLQVNQGEHKRKLTDTQVINMREEAKDIYEKEGRLSVNALAKVHGINGVTVANMLKGKFYKDVGGPILKIDYYQGYGLW